MTTRPVPSLDDAELSHIFERLGAKPGDDASGLGALATERGNLPLAAVDLNARIDGLFAHVSLSQTFVNSTGMMLEATYIFPMPDQFAVYAFRLTVDGRLVEGDIRERGQARRAYDHAKAVGHTVSIVEEDRPDLFTLRVGNLAPGATAVVQFELAGVLPYDEGEATFRFPLVVAPRYVPGLPLPGPMVGSGTAGDTDAAPDASRITPPVLLPGWPSPVRLSIEVELRGGPSAVVDSVRSSLHSIIQDEAVGVRRIRVEPGSRLDRDFVLRYRLGGPMVGSSLSIHPDDATKEQAADGTVGTFALTIVPPEGSTSPRRRAIIFLVDRSGSMEGWKMVAARRAVGSMIDSLTADDAFALLAFATSVETAGGERGQLQYANARARNRAVGFATGLEARGGTELAPALELALDCLTDTERVGSREKFLVLITDGQVANEDEIVKRLAPRLKDVRVQAVGIDEAVNGGLLNRLAGLAKGSDVELVESAERLEQRLDAIHRRLSPPVLSEVVLDSTRSTMILAPETLVPRARPDLHAGAPLVLLGRYRGRPSGAMSVRGLGADGQEPWTAGLDYEVRPHPAIATVWARRQIRVLEDVLVAGSDQVRTPDQIEENIRSLSLRHRVLCRFTAFVAVDRSEVVNSGGEVLSITQPVERITNEAVFSAYRADGTIMGFSSCVPLSKSSGRPPLGLDKGTVEMCIDVNYLQCKRRASPALALPARFRHVRPIHEGFEGRSFEAYDRNTRRKVRIHVIPADPQIAARYAVLRDAVARANHPGLVPILEVMENDAHLLIIFPRPNGRLIANESFKISDAAALVTKFVELIAAARLAGLTPRSSLLDYAHVDRRGRVEVLPSLDWLPDSQSLFEDLAFLAPELSPGQAPTPCSDVVSLGWFLHRLFAAGLNLPRPKGWPEFYKIIRKAVATDPSERFPDPEALLDALRPLAKASKRTVFWKP